MTYVDMKRVEAQIESRIMVLINKRPDAGMTLSLVKRYFLRRSTLQSGVVVNDIPGWEIISETKKRSRVCRVISRLIKGGLARIEKRKRDYGSFYGNFIGTDEYLVPLNVLDKIVFALEQDGS